MGRTCHPRAEGVTHVSGSTRPRLVDRPGKAFRCVSAIPALKRSHPGRSQSAQGQDRVSAPSPNKPS